MSQLTSAHKAIKSPTFYTFLWNSQAFQLFFCYEVVNFVGYLFVKMRIRVGKGVNVFAISSNARSAKNAVRARTLWRKIDESLRCRFANAANVNFDRSKQYIRTDSAYL